MLKMMGEINGRLASGVTKLVDGINGLADKMTQTINSQAEPIVKIETYKEEPSPIYWLPQQYQAEPPPQKNFNVEESIAKIEAHLEKSIKHHNREDGELQGQPMASPDEHYMVDESTYPEQAITTLRSEEVVEKHVEERKEEKKEEQIKVPQDLLWEKCKEVSAEASSPSILIPEVP
jgi:X-X-X-Leu-X-X-Gly heptad repeat protein